MNGIGIVDSVSGILLLMKILTILLVLAELRILKLPMTATANPMKHMIPM